MVASASTFASSLSIPATRKLVRQRVGALNSRRFNLTTVQHFRPSRKRRCSDTYWRLLFTSKTSYEDESIAISAGTSVGDVIHTSVVALERHHGVEESTVSVCNLVAMVLKLPWKSGYRDVRKPEWKSYLLDEQQAKELSHLLQRFQRHEPLQYLLGRWDFLDYTLEVKPPLLCPRPETEELVDLVTKDIEDMPKDNPIRILDVGSGTGCIGVSLAHRFPKASVHAIDVDPIAVEVSRRNGQRILRRGNCDERYSVEVASAESFVSVDTYTVVVSNPPYIPIADMDLLEPNVRDYESHDALTDGTSNDGMDIIRSIVQNLPFWWSATHASCCWMEVDPSHPALLKAWLLENRNLGVDLIRVEKDISDRERFVKLIRAKRQRL